MTGDTTARGYGWVHQQVRARWAAIVARGEAWCARCGEWIPPGAPWDLGHTDDRQGYSGPECRRCNRAAAARKANAQRAQTNAWRRAMWERW